MLRAIGALLNWPLARRLPYLRVPPQHAWRGTIAPRRNCPHPGIFGRSPPAGRLLGES